jgi:hypothetical protein
MPARSAETGLCCHAHCDADGQSPVRRVLGCDGWDCGARRAARHVASRPSRRRAASWSGWGVGSPDSGKRAVGEVGAAATRSPNSRSSALRRHRGGTPLSTVSLQAGGHDDGPTATLTPNATAVVAGRGVRTASSFTSDGSARGKVSVELQERPPRSGAPDLLTREDRGHGTFGVPTFAGAVARAGPARAQGIPPCCWDCDVRANASPRIRPANPRQGRNWTGIPQGLESVGTITDIYASAHVPHDLGPTRPLPKARPATGDAGRSD